jgi:hypothetical protein
MPLDAAIGQVFALYCPGGSHGHQFLLIKMSCGIDSKASIQKAQNSPSNHLIEATSCVEW